MTANEFVSHMGAAAKPRKTSTGWQCRCPAHEDGKASLAVSESGDKVLLHCHAGCTPDAVCAAAGVKLVDLFNGEKLHRNGDARRIVATYDYTDETGKLLSQAVRFEPKDFRQRKPEALMPDGWTWSVNGVRSVPYRLPELRAAVARGMPVFVCEGEKDCDAMHRAGLVATCNAGGAGKWKAEFAEHFRDVAVCVIADKDEPGRNHAQAVAANLHTVASYVSVIEFPDLNDARIKDAADYLSAGGLAADIVALADDAPAWTPAGSVESNPWFALAEDGADIAAQELPPVVEIVDGLLSECVKFLIGSGSKSFKTWLTIYLALAIAHGIPFLGRATLRRRVIYFNLELRPDSFKRRVQAIALALGITPDRSWFVHVPLRGRMAGVSVENLVSRIIALAQHFKADVAVCDPVYKMNTEGDENSSRDQTNFFNQLDRITTEARCALILNDHFSKGNQSEKDPLDAIRGSSAKGGDIDAAMVLRKHEVQNCFRVDVVHRELPPVEPFTIGWNFPLMELRPDLDPESMKKLKGGQPRKHEPLALLALIKATTAQNGISVSAWAKQANISRQTLQSYLPQMRSKDWLSTAGEGSAARQFVTDSGREAVAQWEKAA